MKAELHSSAGVFLLVAALITMSAPTGAEASALDERTESALERIEAVLEMAELSKELWPSWDISDTPFLLRCPDGRCYLVNHPDPPDGSERVRDTGAVDIDVYSVSLPESVPASPLYIEGVPTAVVGLNEAESEAVAASFRAAFVAHGAEDCAGAMEPVVLMSGFPVDPDNQVLADIECELIQMALSAPDDSLDSKVCDFAVVRRYRRLRMGGQYGQYERRAEFGLGIPAYMAERCRREAGDYLDRKTRSVLADALGEPGALERCLAGERDLAWYRDGRFRWSGAAVCFLMDRFDPEWREQAAEECVDPFELLWRAVRRRTPRAPAVLARFDYDRRVADVTSAIEASKSEEEKLFERITRSGHPVFAIDTHLLASGEVRYDPSQVAEVDANRRIQKRLLKLEYSGGTHVHLIGMPVAIISGDDEFDYRKVIVDAPEEYTLWLDGEQMEAAHGVHQFERSLVVEAEGLSIEAHSGTVFIGANGISFVLQR